MGNARTIALLHAWICHASPTSRSSRSRADSAGFRTRSRRSTAMEELRVLRRTDYTSAHEYFAGDHGCCLLSAMRPWRRRKLVQHPLKDRLSPSDEHVARAGDHCRRAPGLHRRHARSSARRHVAQDPARQRGAFVWRRLNTVTAQDRPATLARRVPAPARWPASAWPTSVGWVWVRWPRVCSPTSAPR